MNIAEIERKIKGICRKRTRKFSNDPMEICENKSDEWLYNQKLGMGPSVYSKTSFEDN